jgi:hypothetical protein
MRKNNNRVSRDRRGIQSRRCRGYDEIWQTPQRAVHAFTQKAAGNDNSKGAAYNAEADKPHGRLKAFLPVFSNA